ncbi:MAG: hypothetical protein KAR47_13535 [Planctomycetes bacterium]|nr:hypothetical protein [Planctomycetota bacterium]
MAEAAMTVGDGILVAAVGGLCAGVGIATCIGIAKKFIKWRESERVYEWLKNKTLNNSVRFHTRHIARENDLTEERVYYLCSNHKKIRPTVTKGKWRIIEK